MLAVFEKLREIVTKDFLFSGQFIISILLLVIIILVVLYCRVKRDLRCSEYFLNVIRSVSKALSKNHEIAAFSEDEDIMYTTHPQLYSNKEEFFRHLSGRVTASVNFKNFCRFFEANAPYNTILSGSGSGLHNQFKRWFATITNLDSRDSLTGENISVVTISDVSKQFSEAEKISANYEKLENFLEFVNQQ